MKKNCEGFDSNKKKNKKNEMKFDRETQKT